MAPPKKGRVAVKRKQVRASKTHIDPVQALSGLLEQLLAFRNGAGSLKPCSVVFNADIQEEKVRLAVMLYSTDYSFLLAGSLSGENAELLELLKMVTDNTYSPTPTRRDGYLRRRGAKFEGTFSALYRLRSQKNITFLAAAIIHP